MAAATYSPHTSRARGSATGGLLMLLGAWGGLAPFVGPYFHFGYTPDKVWAYTSGRLWLSAVPGGAALLGGLIALATRNRGVGIFGGLIAALGGAWFIVGTQFVVFVLKRPSINPGIPLHQFDGVITRHTYAEDVGLFIGVGILILFLASIAIGRFSVLAAADVAGDDSLLTDDGYAPAAAAASRAPVAGHDRTAATIQYPGAGSQYQEAGDQFQTGAPYRGFGGKYPGASGYQESGSQYQEPGTQYQSGNPYLGSGGQYQSPSPYQGSDAERQGGSRYEGSGQGGSEQGGSGQGGSGQGSGGQGDSYREGSQYQGGNPYPDSGSPFPDPDTTTPTQQYPPSSG
jgi:hypothetical protein